MSWTTTFHPDNNTGGRLRTAGTGPENRHREANRTRWKEDHFQKPAVACGTENKQESVIGIFLGNHEEKLALRGDAGKSQLMNPEICVGTSVLFQMLSSDLNTSLNTADELSREFDSLMKDCSSNTVPQPDNGPNTYREMQRVCPKASCPPTSSKKDVDTGSTRSPTKAPTLLATEAGPRSQNSPAYDGKSFSPSPVFCPPCQLTTPLSHKGRRPPSCSPQCLHRQSPQARKYDSVPRDRGGSAYLERSPSPCPSPITLDQSFHLKPHPSPTPTSPYPCSPRRSPRSDRRTSPQFVPSPSSSLPRSFGFPSPTASRRQNLPAEWTENNGDMVYGRKPQQKTEQLRSCGPQDPQSPVFSMGSQTLQNKPKASLPRNFCLNPSLPERSSSPSPVPLSPYTLRKSPQSRWHCPVPLSVIMRAEKPLGALVTRHPRVMGLERDGAAHLQVPVLQQHPPQSSATEQRQPARQGSEKEEGDPGDVPRARSPTRLPALAPEATGCPELLVLHSKIPRALKRRGRQDLPLPLGHHRHYQQMIRKLFGKNDLHRKRELGSESSSSSEGEESPKLPAPTCHTPVLATSQHKGLRSILKRPSRDHKSPGHRVQLSPLVLLLDGALVGELDTVQRAAKEMSDPSQANEEGVTALHNAICGGHNTIVDFLVQIGANVSAPDSHGWTPLHCAAACNDSSMCEYLVRSGAAVLSVTEGDGATAAQKCDPFAAGFDVCKSFLRGVEEAMGGENGGILYALWGYPAQVPDELSFRKGDTVTIKKKQEGAEWWWASLGNREGFVPSNYFSLFPKVRPRSLPDQNERGC
ncbi:hypothetical protein SKAU_G00323260 [Synaphobranchus kaupii]|uniref:SH3 domain-containing protein n=1 Tax=Synaphobranchus kaupii TaxID=118154 RepID=A0A9Q1EP34_SYNKA|nr:hypothetical protein SKAU_G00323260 [Synaphobranchus kaupii]